MKIGSMGAATIAHAGVMAQADACRLIVRNEKGLSEILQFVIPGLEIGQQAIVVADPTFLNNIARGLSENGLRPDVFLHSGRLVFLTAPDCLNELLRAGDPLQRSPLHLHGTVMRWVTDWSWALSKGDGLNVIRDYQRRLHDFVRPLNAISICSVCCEKVGRASLLALLANHRRATRTIQELQMLPRAAHA